MRLCRIGRMAGIVVAALLLATAGLAGAQDWEAIEREAASILSRYLAINTVNPPGNETQAAIFLTGILEKEGIEARIYESVPGRGNLYARLKGDGSRRPLVLLSHMDVVTAAPQDWQVPPFSGAIQDGYVWGRGALDMKGVGTIQLLSFLLLKRHAIPLKRDVILLATADEEAGGALGASWMVKNHPDLFKDAEYLLNEGGGIRLLGGGRAYFGVSVAEKTPFWLKLTARGLAGHGSMPRPDSAVDRLIKALAKVQGYSAPIRVTPAVRRFLGDIARIGDGRLAARLLSLKEGEQDPGILPELEREPFLNAMVRNTISITVLAASDKTNVIPAEASAHLDVRLLPGEEPSSFLAALKKVIGDESVSIEPVLSFPPSSSPADTSLMRAIVEVAQALYPGIPVTTPLLTGFTDSHYFRDLGIVSYGVVPFRLAPEDLTRYHGKDERVSIEDLRLGARFYYELLLKLVR